MTIRIENNLPGIIGLLRTYPDTGLTLSAFAEKLLCGDSPLTRAERELVATTVSTANACEFCARSHGAILSKLWGCTALETFAFLGVCSIIVIGRTSGSVIVETEEELSSYLSPSIKEVNDHLNLRSLGLVYIAHIIANNSELNRQDPQVLASGLTDEEINHAALVAASFCMFNRYVTGLNPTIDTDEGFEKTGAHIAEYGYM